MAGGALNEPIRGDTAARTPSPAVEALFSRLGDSEREQVAQALEFARTLYGERLLSSGESAIDHALGMAGCLVDLRMDAATRSAALLFAVPSFEKDAKPKLEKRFGVEVAALVTGVARLNELRVLTRASVDADAVQIEALRKMLLAMVEDIRVVLLRLASRTQTLRFLARGAVDEERQVAIARETFALYAPLANRLGIWQLKWELEDLAFRFIEPTVYRRIAAMLEERRVEREAFIARSIEALSAALAAAGIEAEVSGRPKHIYSIYNKMRGKSLSFEQLHDVRALRVLVPEVRDCYTALGFVHDMWQPLPEDFDDYIARPKDNLYRSLHTAVIAPDGRPLEVQIRTHEMHRVAELGVAAHWRYKEGDPRSGPDYDQKIAMLRRMLAWRDEVADSADWADRTRRAALDQTIYVLTPDNRVVDLPRGSTPVDFAYSVHTGLGHRCRGAKVNGAIVPLDRRLENGDRVEIIAARAGESGPSRDWLNPSLGYLASTRARHKVRQWFNAVELQNTVASGRAFVERELQREGSSGLAHVDLASALGFGSADALYAAAGREEVGHRQIQVVVRARSGVEEKPEETVGLVSHQPMPARSPSGILVVGVDRLLTQLARCCKPVPPDPITGFVTRGRGVSIHRARCPSLARLKALHPERLLDAEWGSQSGASRTRGSTSGATFAVDVVVHAQERLELLRDISEVLAREQVRVSGLQTQARSGSATLFMTLEVDSLEQLKRTLPLMESVTGVSSARRR